MNNTSDFLSIVNAIYLNTEYSTPYFANNDQTVSIAFFTAEISSFIKRKLGKRLFNIMIPLLWVVMV